MAIIRNERKSQRQPEPQQAPEPEEIEVDYDWHPTEDEYVSPLTAEQWAELLADPGFADTDQAKAIRCLRDYGEPATFQQLSIRYRGTMGRYRRWLSEAAQTAGQRFGVPAPQQDQFGMDEWWPLLYQTRTTGKIGAGVFEMLLRPEVDEAFDVIAEQERQAKRAENARNLKRIEQLERARQEERQRKAEREAAQQEQARKEQERARQEQERRLAAERERIAKKAAEEEASAKAAAEEEAARQAKAESDARRAKVEAARQAESAAETSSVQTAPTTPEAPASAADEPATHEPQELPATMAYLDAVTDEESRGGMRYVVRGEGLATVDFNEAAPIDFALRYAERLRHAFALMHDGAPWINLAAVAREVGDESVERLQSMLNGQEIPPFSYLDALEDAILINPAFLEARDGLEDKVPVFCTLCETLGTNGATVAIQTEVPREIAYVVDDSKDRRSGVVLSFGPLRCTLLARETVEAEGDRSKNRELDAYMSMVDELDDFASARGIAHATCEVTSKEFDELVRGRMWPGGVLR